MLPAVKFLFNDTQGRAIAQMAHNGEVVTLPNLAPVDPSEPLTWEGNKGEAIHAPVLEAEWRSRMLGTSNRPRKVVVL